MGMSYSLLLEEKNNKLKAYGAAEEISASQLKEPKT